MRANNVLLSRRKTGGGAVYQDLGNTCFSFLNPDQSKGKIDYKTLNNAILIQAFENLGVPAEVSGRNDILVKGKKISGSAYRLHLGGKGGIGRKTLHHGTVLFSVDMSGLLRYLNPNKKKLQSKGVDSVISRVLNLTQQYPQLNHQVFCKQLTKQFCQFYQQTPETQWLDYDTLNKNPQIKKNYQRLSSWQWLYGQTPDFTYSIEKKFGWGLIQIQFNVKEALISDAIVYSDCLIPDFITVVNQEIKGVRYDGTGVIELKARIMSRKMDDVSTYQAMTNDICQWVADQM